jgi:hypothetical protein
MEQEPSIDITDLVDTLSWDQKILDLHYLGDIPDARSENDPVRFVLEYVAQYHGFYLTFIYQGNKRASHRVNLERLKIGSVIGLEDPYLASIIESNIACLQTRMGQPVIDVSTNPINLQSSPIEVLCA